MTIWELDNCNHLNITYEPDIDSRHPVSKINIVLNTTLYTVLIRIVLVSNYLKIDPLDLDFDSN